MQSCAVSSDSGRPENKMEGGNPRIDRARAPPNVSWKRGWNFANLLAHMAAASAQRRLMEGPKGRRRQGGRESGPACPLARQSPPSPHRPILTGPLARLNHALCLLRPHSDTDHSAGQIFLYIRLWPHTGSTQPFTYQFANIETRINAK